MIDWYGAMLASDYKRDEVVEESGRAELIKQAEARNTGEEHVERTPLLGALGVALVALVATGAIGPR